MNNTLLNIIILISLSVLSLYPQQNKISPDLIEKMKLKSFDDLIQVVIEISPQPNIANIIMVANNMTKSQRKNYIISQLKSHATNTQLNVLSYLYNKENEGAEKGSNRSIFRILSLFNFKIN